MTILQARQTALSRMLKENTDSYEMQLCVRLLLDEIAGISHAHLTRGGDLLSTSQLARFEVAVHELESGRPLAYVLGKRDFYRLCFRSDARALVPRPETELLVEEVVKRIQGSDSAVIADLGTGTGCIAISLAHELPGTTVFATDVSPAALSLAQENANTLIPEIVAGNRLQFRAGTIGEWAKPLLEYSGKFDLIVSNPPYIPREEIEVLQREVRDHEPRLALDGGADGLDCYRQLAAQCDVLLKPAGALLCELGMGQFADVRAIFENQNWRVEIPIFDFAGIERILVAHRLP